MNPADTSHRTLHADVVIFGGGVAGLWLSSRLRAEGYRVLLLETSDLGSGQSVASQGIIHGGLKYALDGSFGTASHAIATMPQRWRASLAGTADVDLRGCSLLQDRFYMWSDGGYRSRLKTFLGSKSLRGRVEAVPRAEYPELFAIGAGRGSLYRLPDFVVDTGSLLRTLGADRDDLLLIAPDHLGIERLAGGELALEVRCGGQPLQINTRSCLLCAGAGNGRLMDRFGMRGITLQTRPLHMVMVKHPSLPAAYVHCIGNDFSLTPRLTLTSHPCLDGSTVWYLGGELAERGVGMSSAEVIEEARQLLGSLFPGVSLKDALWTSFPIDRAEGSVDGQRRPDTVFLQRQDSVWVCWPTKFTLSPALADQAVAELQAAGIHPIASARPLRIPAGLAHPGVARPPWETLF